MRSKAIAFWLCLFLGVFGIHRFYLGKPFSGVLWFFTAGFFGIGLFFDILRIGFGLMRDGQGNALAVPGFLHNSLIKAVTVFMIVWLAACVAFVVHSVITQPQLPLFDPGRLPKPLTV